MLFLILNRVEISPYIDMNEPMFPTVHYPNIGNEHDNYSELYKEIIFPKHNLDKLFKIDLVSIPDEKLAKTEREAFDKEYLEDQIINLGRIL